MDYKDLKEKKKEDLTELLAKERASLKDLQFKVSSQELKNVREIRVTRKKIAQVLTALKRFGTKINY